MSDPKVFIDYEFHFATGEPVFVPPALEHIDTLRVDGECIRVTRTTEDIEEVTTVHLSKLNGWKRTRRVERDEP